VRKSDLRGVIAASITPITAAGAIDVPRLTQHVARLIADGCSFVSTFGTTGEGASFSTREKIAALKALKAAGADMKRQVPAVMTPTLDDAAQMVMAIADLGCRAALILPPFYYPTTDAGIAGFFDALVCRTKDADALDLLLYNIPQLSRVRFTPELVAKILGRHSGRVVGIKDSTGDLENGLMLVSRFPDLAIFTGDDRVLPRLVSAGGAGMIGGMPNVFARELRAIFDNPTSPLAADLSARQAERIAAVDANGSLLALKSAVAYYRHDDDYARALPPLVALTTAQQAEVIAAFEKSGFVAAA
jgi:4-hydroxy-tetrahydrodipicolinate synthase